VSLLILGTALTAVSWLFAWSNAGILSEYSFFPLWLGYILTINGIAEAVYRTSLIRVMRWYFLVLFIGSIPLWWFFEVVNRVVQNWEYILPHPISGLHYVIQASTNFATVLPAVLSTAFVAHRMLRGYSFETTGVPWIVGRIRLQSSILVGLMSFAALWVFPHETFPLVWIAPILLLEPVAYVTGLPSLLRVLAEGRCLLPVSVMSATLFTGIWWELWNFYSMPKWIYHVPDVGFWKVFEMPVLGYLGYPFFGIIVFSWASIVLATIFKQDLITMFDNRR
jgi:hypothetical protein